jgi:chromosomal replication initiation ATPase DnaA
MSMRCIWDDVAVLVAARTNRFTFSTWFKPVKFISDDGVALRVLVPNGLFREWFLTHYSPIVEQALAELGRDGTIVSYLVDEGIRSDAGV